MTTTVTMLQTRLGEGGSLWTVGNSYAASDAFAAVLISSNLATGTLPKSRSLVPLWGQTDSTGAVASVVSGDGTELQLSYPSGSYRTVLFGDSMTSQYSPDTTPSASYDPASGLLTLTSVSNPIATGWTGRVFNRTYAALKSGRQVTFTYVSDTSVSCFVGANLPGVPTGALGGTTFLRADHKIGSNSPLNWLQQLMGWPFDVVYNGAQSGDTAGDCLARIEVDCLAHAPQVVVMQMPGINDSSAGNGPVDAETTYANQVQIVDQILGAGAFLVLFATTPCFTGEARATRAVAARVAALNRRLGNYVKTKRSCVWFDAFDNIVDKTSATGIAVAGLLKSTDNIHYSMVGAQRVADAALTKLQAMFPAVWDSRPDSAIDTYAASAVTASSLVVASGIATFTSPSHGHISGEKVLVSGATPTELNGWKTIKTAETNTFTFASASSDQTATGTILAGTSRNLFSNPLFLTASGGTVTFGVSGTAAGSLVAKNCSGAAGGLTAVASVVAHGTHGNAQRLVCSAASADDRPGFEFTPTSLLNALMVAGNQYSLECELSIASANWANTAVSEIQTRFMVNAGGTLYSGFSNNTYDGLPAAGSLSANRVLHIKTPPIKVPAGAITQAYIQVYVRAAGTWTSNVTLELARVGVLDVTGP